MITLEICIGSSCYVKGSNQVVKIINNWRIKNDNKI